jgi:hypothetical protein
VPDKSHAGRVEGARLRATPGAGQCSKPALTCCIATSFRRPSEISERRRPAQPARSGCSLREARRVATDRPSTNGDTLPLTPAAGERFLLNGDRWSSRPTAAHA